MDCLTTQNSRTPKHGQCPLCLRAMHLTFHHLIPRKMHRRSFFKKNYTKHELNNGIMICEPCHKALHRFHSEMELAKRFNTLADIKADSQLAAHFSWLSKQRVKTPR
ncbi:HNH endonuclease [Alteromonas flava]|uniref:HNH endonuclease n=1 Tax=Alteromonas flava TaxID=2048003 RepID=UPI000C28722E|nr:HNH endonuclease [Alteromonas flava]